ncbi:MAG: hypothetical protein GF331_24315 [Chitinivibrionales bacterium]|nr:hypothetical protein [Chitinivibrionales bacterium]
MLDAVLEVLDDAVGTDQVIDQVSDQVSDQVAALLIVMGDRPVSASSLMKSLRRTHRPSFREHYLHPALRAGLIEMTVPDRPRSRLQRYRLTGRGGEVRERLRCG